MAQQKQRYKVNGFGEFPIDMLRYDEVYPASERDSDTIMNSRSQRTVEVAGRSCTPARWESFLWRVIK
jgi:hypothetical protein